MAEDDAEADAEDRAAVVPLHGATGRVDGADHVAAGGVVAHRRGLRLLAVTDAGALVESDADRGGGVDAGGVPPLGAAELEAGDRADRGGAFRIVAGRREVELVARLAGVDDEGDVADGEGLGGAHRVPADLAAPGVVVLAHVLAADAVAAAGLGEDLGFQLNSSSSIDLPLSSQQVVVVFIDRHVLLLLFESRHDIGISLKA